MSPFDDLITYELCFPGAVTGLGDNQRRLNQANTQLETSNERRESVDERDC